MLDMVNTARCYAQNAVSLTYGAWCGIRMFTQASKWGVEAVPAYLGGYGRGKERGKNAV